MVGKMVGTLFWAQYVLEISQIEQVHKGLQGFRRLSLTFP